MAPSDLFFFMGTYIGCKWHMTITAYNGPLDIPEFSPLITESVKEFAEPRGLKSILWYHGDPWWFIREEVVPKKFFREVHVAVFSRTGHSYLFFMPQACRFEPKVPPKVVRPEKWVQRSVKELRALGPDGARKEIGLLLTQAWQVAQALTMSE